MMWREWSCISTLTRGKDANFFHIPDFAVFSFDSSTYKVSYCGLGKVEKDTSIGLSSSEQLLSLSSSSLSTLASLLTNPSRIERGV